MDKKQKAEKIILNHVIYAMGISAIPLPFVDVLGVTAIQMDMLKQLSELYGIRFDENRGKAFITSLLSSTLAGTLAAGARVAGDKGRIASWLSTILLQGAVTYALGQLFLSAYDEKCKSIFDLDMEKAGDLFEEAFEKGKEYVEKLTRGK